MKKSLLAVAAIGAFASAAQAQSSVTVYGILDVGYVGANTRDTTSAQAKTQYSGFGQSAEQSSRLGFKGNEDLGGGMSAFFTVELGLNPENTTLSTFNNRQSFVGIKKNGIGAGAVGLQYTPVFNLDAAIDPGQHNGTIGNVVYVSNNNSAVAPVNANINATGAFTNTTANTLTFKSDKFAGASFEAMYTLNNKDQTQSAASAGGNTNTNGWGVKADYTWNKLYVGAAYQSLKQETTASGLVGVSGLTVSTIGGANVTSASVNSTDNQALAGATYDFGILKAYVQWVNRKGVSNLNSNQFIKRSAQQIGVRSFITPKIEGWASAGNGRYTGFGSSEPTINFTGYQLGSNYWLSKRTNLYAIFGSMQSSSSSVVTGAGSSGNQYAVGVRHTF